MDRTIRGRPGSLAPRFCDRCRGEGSADGSLCPDCGESLVDRGYCPTCEGFWKQRVGSACPKHEVELVEAPPEPPPLGLPGVRTALVTVATFSHPNQANAPRIRLEAEGITTFLDGERIAGSTLYQVATGGVRLQVPAPQASAARILLAQTWAPPQAEGDDADDDLDDAWDDLAPEPGQKRRAIMKLAILVFLFGPAVIALTTFLSNLAKHGLP